MAEYISKPIRICKPESKNQNGCKAKEPVARPARLESARIWKMTDEIKKLASAVDRRVDILA